MKWQLGANSAASCSPAEHEAVWGYGMLVVAALFAFEDVEERIELILIECLKLGNGLTLVAVVVGFLGGVLVAGFFLARSLVLFVLFVLFV
jgi:hypothetical protein